MKKRKAQNEKTKEKPLVREISKTGVHNERRKVVPPGIEPGTHGFSVRCSTN